MKIKLIYFCFCLGGCFTMDVVQKKMGEYKLKNGDLVELVNKGVGATAPNITWVFKTDGFGEKVVVTKIIGPSDNYLVTFNQLNDTLLKIMLTDTSFFIGDTIPQIINLKGRIKINE